MTIVINGTNSPVAGSIGYGDGTNLAFTAAGTTGQFLTSATAGTPTWTTLASGFTLGTPVATTSGTSIDFTGLPAGTKQIIITFFGVSTSGTSIKLIQIGDSGGIETTSYLGTSFLFDSTNSPAPTDSTAGYPINSIVSGDTLYGAVTLTLENSTTNRFVASGIVINGSGGKMFTVAGGKALSATLDRIRLTTVNGIDTFDAGEVNIAYI